MLQSEENDEPVKNAGDGSGGKLHQSFEYDLMKLD